ncbi:MAG: hypothetical protein CMJ34_01735 [Phycisphaerae bacterium]|nr:hypothetical protein [Phycisphaerae bacterium]
MIEHLHLDRTCLGLIVATSLTGAASADALALLLERGSPSGSEAMIDQDPPSDGEASGTPVDAETDSDSGSPLGWNIMFERIERGTHASLGYLHEFGTDFGDGGSVSVDRAFGSIGTELRFHPEVTGSVALAWGGDWYRFKGDSELSPAPGVTPWNSVQAVTAIGLSNWQLDQRWSMNLGLRIGFAGETQARFSDSLTFGGNAALSYAFSEKLSIGGGVLLSSQIEDSILAIPVVIVYWQVTDTVVVSNVLGPEAYPTGAGLEIAWRPDRISEVSIGSRYEVRRFRLDDTGPANRSEGVGEDSGLPIWLRSTWRFSNGIRMDIVGGVSLFNEYRLDDRNGNRISNADLDPAAFIAGFVSWRF